MIFGGAGSGGVSAHHVYRAGHFSVSGIALRRRRQFKDARESVMGQTFPVVMKQVCGLTSRRWTRGSTGGISVIANRTVRNLVSGRRLSFDSTTSSEKSA